MRVRVPVARNHVDVGPRLVIVLREAEREAPQPVEVDFLERCEAITVVRYDDGSFFIFFQPNVGIRALTGFWPERPRSVDELGRIGHVDLAHPTLMNQIPAYATQRDATTGALPANRAGSWRRNQLRLEAGVNVPAWQGHI